MKEIGFLIAMGLLIIGVILIGLLMYWIEKNQYKYYYNDKKRI